MTTTAEQLKEEGRKEARLEDARNMLKEISLANEVYHLPLKPRGDSTVLKPLYKA